MTLGSETAALLVLATHALGFQTSAAQHALLTPEERKSALRQLMVTVETAGELAKVAHVEALAKHKGVDGDMECKGADPEQLRRVDGDMECKGADPEQLRAEPGNFGREAARAALETKGVGVVGGAGANSTQTVYGRLVEESEMRKVDNEKGDKEVEKSLQDTEKSPQDTERIYAMLVKFGNNVDKVMQEMEALNAELEKVKREKLEAEGEARKSVAEMEKSRLEMDRTSDDMGFGLFD